MNLPAKFVSGMALAFFVLVLGLPALIVSMNTPKGMEQKNTTHTRKTLQQDISIAVFSTDKQIVEQVPMETYVRGVVAAEMPKEFHLEALKAQAIAARTYIFKRWLEGDNRGVPVEGAIVTDTEKHQVYLSEDQLLKDRFSWDDEHWEKLNRAVDETEGLVASFQNEPIEAAFFSTSNGYTENSEDYWSTYVPYLRSVASPWDAALSPKYRNTVVLNTDEMLKKLEKDMGRLPSNWKSSIEVLEWSEGRRIKKIRIGDRIFSGRQIRERLDLNSTHFTFHFEEDKAYITTFGYGHGVGMSQYGANGMALEGSTAEEIIKYYYTGVNIEPLSNLLPSHFQRKVSQR